MTHERVRQDLDQDLVRFDAELQELETLHRYAGKLPDPSRVAAAIGEARRRIARVTPENLTVAQLVAYFESHCECRPTDISRTSHSHDCDTACCDDVWLAVHGTPHGTDFRSYDEVITQARGARERICEGIACEGEKQS